MAAIIIDKEKKKAHILMAAIKTFSTKGFTKTTINDIAVSAGIGKGTVYEYFKSKNEIIHNSFLFFTESMMGDFENILSSNLKAKDKLIDMLKAFCHITEGESGKLLDIMMDFWSEGLRSECSIGILKEDMRKMYISYRNLLSLILNQGIGEGSFKENIDPESLGAIIVGMLDGLMVQWILDREKINIEKSMDSFIKMVLNGIENK